MARDTTTLVPWFGSNRKNAALPGRLLTGCKWVGVPFAGGMSEVPHITAPTIVVNDIHRHVVNLASVTAHPVLGPILYRRLRRKAFHPETLAAAQKTCEFVKSVVGLNDIDAAEHYAVAAWMGRSASAGTSREFKGYLPVRWNGNGGDSNTRFRSGARAILEFGRAMRRCNFVVEDAFAFLDRVGDDEKNGLYLDPPWPDDGRHYENGFTEEQQRRLRDVLCGFEQTKVVLRYGDHPLVRELYDSSRWRVLEVSGRTQANDEKRELLICNF